MREMSTKEDASSFLDCITFPILQNFLYVSLSFSSLDNKHWRILNYFLEHPNSTVANVKEAQLQEIKDLDYNTIRRYIIYLNDLNLIEIKKSEPMTNMKSKFIRYYQLSLSGILHVIMYGSEQTSGYVIHSIMRHYRNNVLFNIFIYPFIKEQTLMALTPGSDFKIFTELLVYLKDICRTIFESLKSLSSATVIAYDEYMRKQIFSWFNDTANPLPYPSILSLQFFLHSYLKWDWAYESQIIPNINEKIIEIKNPYNSIDNAYVKIIINENRGVLRQNGKKIFEFHINNETEQSLTFEIRTHRKRIDSIDFNLIDHAKER